MLFKKFLTAAVALGLSAPGAFAEGHGGTLDKIAANGEIVIGHRESSVPFSYLDENRSRSGIPSSGLAAPSLLRLFCSSRTTWATSSTRVRM